MRRIWFSVVICVALGAAIGYPAGNVVLGIFYGAVVGIGIGLLLDRRVPGKPYTG
jgi:F0F1-type ATP synthase assembly protein I